MAIKMNYIELHARSAFSFLEGASVPEELIAACKAHEMPAMALLDRNGVYGSPRFHLAAQKNGIKAHIGAEVTVQGPKSKVQSQKQDRDVQSSTFNVQGQKQDREADIGHWTLDIGQKYSATPKETFSIPVLVRNRTGYQNLCRLITLMKLACSETCEAGGVCSHGGRVGGICGRIGLFDRC